jgi:pimeloyl-ACP methyl ester carboxylesterase
VSAEPLHRRAGVLEGDGERLYFEVIGQGEPLVLCHGLGGNHGSWWQQVQPLARSGLQVVTWDQRGFGNSTRATGPFGPGPAVADLDRLLDHLALSRVHLVGQSMGGWVAMGAALEQPERFASLTLTDTLAGVLTAAIADLVAASMAALGGGMRTDVVGAHPALGQAFRTARPDLALLYEELSGFGDKPPDDEMFTLLGNTRYDPAAVARLALPALLLVGEQDPLCPPAAMRLIAELLPDATLVVLDQCGHSPYFEDPARWNAALLEFLALHRADGQPSAGA